MIRLAAKNTQHEDILVVVLDPDSLDVLLAGTELHISLVGLHPALPPLQLYLEAPAHFTARLAELTAIATQHPAADVRFLTDEPQTVQ